MKEFNNESDLFQERFWVEKSKRCIKAILKGLVDVAERWLERAG